MPKDKSVHASTSQKNRYHAYKQPSNNGKALLEGDSSDVSSGKNDWKDARCPICMDYPHNAVLLLCSSHDKGCCPYMCNTSYRHSNCLDQYRKAHMGKVKACHSRDQAESSSRRNLESRIGRLRNVMDTVSSRTNGRNMRNTTVNVLNEPPVMHSVDLEPVSSEEGDCTEELDHGGSLSSVKGIMKGLVCPLCRGKVKGWKVVNSARDYLNLKARSCAQESCSFVGSYEELRVHARQEHPLARPSEVDPVRQRDWSRMERRRDLGDVLSTIHSTMPGATVMGDYVIEHEEEEEDDDVDFPGDDGHWWTVFLLFQIFGPANSVASEGMRLRSQSRVPRRSLWGESLPRSGHVDASMLSGSSDPEEQPRRSSRRQRRNRHRADQ